MNYQQNVDFGNGQMQNLIYRENVLHFKSELILPRDKNPTHPNVRNDYPFRNSNLIETHTRKSVDDPNLVRNDFPIQNSRNNFPIKNSRNDFPIQISRNTFPIQYSHNDFPIQNSRNDFPIRDSRNDFPIQNSPNNFPIQNLRNAVPI